MIKALNSTGFDLIRAGNRSPCSLWCVICILPPGLAVGVILYPQHSKNKQKFVVGFHPDMPNLSRIIRAAPHSATGPFCRGRCHIRVDIK
jgi:hypothetical protein